MKIVLWISNSFKDENLRVGIPASLHNKSRSSLKVIQGCMVATGQLNILMSAP